MGHNGHVSKTNMLPFVYPKVAGQYLAEYYENGTYLLERQFMKDNTMSRIAMVNLAHMEY